MGVSRHTVKDIANDISKNHRAFIGYARHGISGNILKQTIKEFGHHQLFVRLLDAPTDNLGKLYRKEALPRPYSEVVLDTMRLFFKARFVFGNQKKASRWFERKVPALDNQIPIKLCDTFEGRKIVQNTLDRIEYGELVA